MFCEFFIMSACNAPDSRVASRKPDTATMTPKRGVAGHQTLLHQSSEQVLLLPAICETSKQQLSLVEFDRQFYRPKPPVDEWFSAEHFYWSKRRQEWTLDYTNADVRRIMDERRATFKRQSEVLRQRRVASFEQLLKTFEAVEDTVRNMDDRRYFTIEGKVTA